MPLRSPGQSGERIRCVAGELLSDEKGIWGLMWWSQLA